MADPVQLTSLSGYVNGVYYTQIHQMRKDIQQLNEQVVRIAPELKLAQLEEDVILNQIAAIQFQETGDFGLGVKKFMEDRGKGYIGQAMEYVGLRDRPRTVGLYEISMNRISMLCNNESYKNTVLRLKNHFHDLDDISLDDPQRLSYQDKVRLIEHPYVGYGLMKLAHLADYDQYRMNLATVGAATKKGSLSSDQMLTLSLAHNGGYDFMMRVILQTNIMQLARHPDIAIDFQQCMNMSTSQAMQFAVKKTIFPTWVAGSTIPKPGLPMRVRPPVQWDYDKKISIHGVYKDGLRFSQVLDRLNAALALRGLPTIILKTDKQGKILGIQDSDNLIKSSDLRGLKVYFARFGSLGGYKPWVDADFVRANSNWMNVSYFDLHKDLLLFSDKYDQLILKQRESERKEQEHLRKEESRKTYRARYGENGSLRQGSLSPILWLKSSYIPRSQKKNQTLNQKQIDELSLLKGKMNYNQIIGYATMVDGAYRIGNERSWNRFTNGVEGKLYRCIVGLTDAQGNVVAMVRVIKDPSGSGSCLLYGPMRDVHKNRIVLQKSPLDDILSQGYYTGAKLMYLPTS